MCVLLVGEMHAYQMVNLLTEMYHSDDLLKQICLKTNSDLGQNWGDLFDKDRKVNTEFDQEI